MKDCKPTVVLIYRHTLGIAEKLETESESAIIDVSSLSELHS